MANKLPFYYIWDIKSVLWSIFVLTGFIVFLLSVTFFHDWNRAYQLNQFDAETDGEITDIKEQTYIRQSQEGNELRIDHYQITYVYYVNDQKILGTDKIEGTNKTINKLIKIYRSTDRAIKVRYNSLRPEESLLDLEVK